MRTNPDLVPDVWGDQSDVKFNDQTGKWELKK